MPLARRLLIRRRDYREAVLKMPGLAGYWRLGEKSGLYVRDETGRNPGTYVNTPTLGVTGALTGDADTAVTFTSASSEYVDIADAAVLRLAIDWSVAFWIKTSTPGKRIVSKRDAPPFWEVYIDAAGGDAGRIVVYMNDGAVADAFYSTAHIDDGAWHFVVCVRSGTSGWTYVDGVINGANPQTHAVSGSTAGTAPLAIGTYGNHGGDFLNGSLDEVALVNRPVFAAKIAALYRIGRGL